MYQGCGYILAIISFSFLYNILKFFELRTVYPAGNLTEHEQPAWPRLEFTELRRSPVYTTVCSPLA